jgi:hypothetical protein
MFGLELVRLPLQCRPQPSKTVVVVPSARKPTFLIVVCCRVASLKEELNSCKEEKTLFTCENLLDEY